MKLNGTILGLCGIILTGCGGAQDGTVTPVTVGQSRMHQASGSSGDLLYVATRRTVYVISYPQGDIVGSFHEGGHYIHDVCADPNDGTVFITDDQLIRKFPHGATRPSVVLHTPSTYIGFGCAVDRNTGNLAVAATLTNGTGAILVHSKTTRKWAIYPSGTNECTDATYDNVGDIYATCQGPPSHQFLLEELVSGQKKTKTIEVVPSMRVGPYTLQWDGSYLTMEDESGGVISQAKVHRGTAKVVGTTQLLDASGDYAYWIQGGSVLAWYNGPTQGGSQAVGVWDYPQGGYPTHTFYGIGRKGLWSLAVSVAPTASRK